LRFWEAYEWATLRPPKEPPRIRIVLTMVAADRKRVMVVALVKRMMGS
jgi:hypothetical protein